MGAEQSATSAPVTGGGGAVATTDHYYTPTASSAAKNDTFSPSQSTPKALVIVGPSGVGKGTLIKLLMDGSDRFGFSTSHTTRQPRPGEIHGQHYFFTTREQICQEIAEGKFLEYAEVHGKLYGTSKDAVTLVLDSGRVCVLDIDVQGARLLRKSGIGAIFVFVAPPSLEDLAKRLVGRGTETVEQVTTRMGNAKAEINSLNEKGLYDYLIINDNLDEALVKLREVAARATAGLDPEPGHIPESVIIEDAPLPDISMYIQQAQEEAAAAAATATAEPSLAPLAVPPEPPVLSSEPTIAVSSPVVTVSSESPKDDSGASPGALSGTREPLVQPVLVTDGAAPPSSSQPPLQLSPLELSSVSVAHLTSPLPEAPLASPAAAAAASVVDGMAKWRRRVALVTGSSSGIGSVVCETLAASGMLVVAVARRKERLEELQQRIVGELGVPPADFLPVVCDITKDAEVATLPKIVAKRWPGLGIDVLINNAGMSRSDGSLFEGSIASWVEMLSTNVLGTAMCTRAVLQDMMRRNSYGHIINMVGLSGHRIPDGPQGGGFYCGTKSAVKTITEGLRQEARGRGVPLRVSAISPGIVETEFFQVKAFGDDTATQKATSQFKCLEPIDVARAILWCLSAPEHVEVNDIVVRPSEQML